MTAPYTTADLIAAYLGTTFDAEQEAQATTLATAATAYIDGYTGQSWQAPSPIVAEWLPIIARRDDGAETAAPTVYLRRRPVVSVDAVSVRYGGPGATATVLDAVEYELTDAAHGVLRLAAQAIWTGQASPYLYAYGDALVALVDYAFSDAPPPDIALAATMIGSSEMARVMGASERSAMLVAHPELAGLKSVAVGQNDVAVQIADASRLGAATGAGSAWAAPGSAVAGILDLYRRAVIA